MSADQWYGPLAFLGGASLVPLAGAWFWFLSRRALRRIRDRELDALLEEIEHEQAAKESL